MASSTRKAFNEAFRSAADSGAKTFEFEGKSYSTKMAPEKTTSNRGLGGVPSRKSSKDIADYPTSAIRPGKVERDKPREQEEMSIMPKPKSSGLSVGFGAEPIEDVRTREQNMRGSIKSMAESDLTPKAGDRPTDGYRKGGMVKAKRTSNRGAGIAVKGFGRARGR
jgi:hypothetical protein